MNHIYANSLRHHPDEIKIRRTKMSGVRWPHHGVLEKSRVTRFNFNNSFLCILDEFCAIPPTLGPKFSLEATDAFISLGVYTDSFGCSFKRMKKMYDWGNRSLQKIRNHFCRKTGKYVRELANTGVNVWAFKSLKMWGRKVETQCVCDHTHTLIFQDQTVNIQFNGKN